MSFQSVFYKLFVQMMNNECDLIKATISLVGEMSQKKLTKSYKAEICNETQLDRVQKCAFWKKNRLQKEKKDNVALTLTKFHPQMSSGLTVSSEMLTVVVLINGND